MPLINFSLYTFHIPARYSPGQTIGAVEAEWLNSTMAGLIRKRLERRWTEISKFADELGFLPDEIVESFREEVGKVEGGFEFGQKERRREPEGPLAVEIRKCAEERAGALPPARPSAFPPDRPSLPLIREFMQQPSVLAEAKRRLRVKLRQGKKELEELLEDDAPRAGLK